MGIKGRMTKEEALAFLAAHQPLPDDREITQELLDQFDAARTLFLRERDERCVPLFLNSFGEGSGFGVYQLVADVIRRYPERVVIPALRDSVRSRRQGVRSWSWDIALEHPGSELVPLAIEALRASDEDERNFAAAYLIDASSGRDVPVLAEARDREPDPSIKAILSEAVDSARNRP